MYSALLGRPPSALLLHIVLSFHAFPACPCHRDGAAFIMFYSTTVLTKRGPLAKVWLAAHVSNKLTKAMALSTNISNAVKRIIEPDAPMALRLTSQLLLGVVRIFSRKTKYLLVDSSDALARLKIAYTPASANDLPNAHANPAAITLADNASPARRRRGGGDGGGVGASASASLDGMAMPDMDFPEARSTPGAAPKYLADAKDITIDEYSGGAGIDAFGRDMDLDLLPVEDIERDRLALGYDDMDEEPLMFTPSQQRVSAPSTPLKSSENGGSIEAMRDAAVPGAAGNTPRLNFGDLDGAADDDDDENKLAEGSALEKEAALSIGEHTPRDSLGGGGGLDLSMGPEESPGGGLPFGLPDDNDLLLAADEGNQAESKVGEEEKDDDEPQEGDKKTENNEIYEALGAPKAGGKRRLSKRKRRAPGVLWDEETELSATFIRGCLQDTSDIVRPAKRARPVRGSHRTITARDILSRPIFSVHAPELEDIVDMCFNMRDALKEPGSPITGTNSRKRRRGPTADEDEDEGDEDDGRGEEKIEKESAEENEELTVKDGTVDGEILPLSPVIPVGEEDAEKDDLRLSMSEPRFSFGGASPDAESMPRMSLAQDETPLPVCDEQPLPLPDADPENLPGVASQDLPQDGVLSFAKVARTLVVVKDADAEADGELGDARMTNRALKMRDLLAQRVDTESGSVPFSAALDKESGVTRRIAARSFYELLNLCSKRVIALEQDGAYGPISVTPVQPAFDYVASPGDTDSITQ